MGGFFLYRFADSTPSFSSVSVRCRRAFSLAAAYRTLTSSGISLRLARALLEFTVALGRFPKAMKNMVACRLPIFLSFENDGVVEFVVEGGSFCLVWRGGGVMRTVFVLIYYEEIAVTNSIEVKWQKPISLKARPITPGRLPTRERSVTWRSDDHEELRGYGVYVFVRRHGSSYIPLYIGISKNVYTRIRQHFTQDQSEYIRSHIRYSGGDKMLIVGMLPSGTPNPWSVLKIVEKTLIVKAVTCRNGKYKDELFNTHGNYSPRWRGNRNVINGLTCLEEARGKLK